MTLTRIDVNDYDDTELGAEVRAAFALGCTIVVLYDGGEPDTRANTWVDGTHGLYRMRCAQEHYWLSALERHGPYPVVKYYVQSECPTCGRIGESVDA